MSTQLQGMAIWWVLATDACLPTTSQSRTSGVASPKAQQTFPTAEMFKGNSKMTSVRILMYNILLLCLVLFKVVHLNMSQKFGHQMNTAIKPAGLMMSVTTSTCLA